MCVDVLMLFCLSELIECFTDPLSLMCWCASCHCQLINYVNVWRVELPLPGLNDWSWLKQLFDPKECY